MTKRNRIKRFFDFFRTQRQIIETLRQLDRLIEIKVSTIADRIEELDPSKTYFIYLKNVTGEELASTKELIERATKSIPWTSPGIIVSNVNIETKKRRKRRR